MENREAFTAEAQDAQLTSPKVAGRRGRDAAGRLFGTAMAIAAFTACGSGTGYLLDLARGPAAEAATVRAEPSWAEQMLREHQAFAEVIPATIGLTAKLARNETLAGLLTRSGAPAADAARAIAAMTPHLDPRYVRPGFDFNVALADAEAGGGLMGLSVKHATDRSIYISRNADGSFTARELAATTTPEVHVVRAAVGSTLYAAALEAGAGDQQVVDFADVFAYDVDFQREIWSGDTFEFVYDRMVDERGNYVNGGPLLYAAIDGNALTKGYYRFTPSDDGITDYFDAEGTSSRRFLMRTPINGARLSSSFGMRRHPVLGYNRLHRGTDFAAPTGTPIYAAGSGVVEVAGWQGAYGRYVKLQHPNGWETAYAHMSRFASGVRAGSRVRQGEVIGYVGTTGRSTGPHLHYEVLQNGAHVNPMTIRLPTGRKLEGEQLAAFMAERARIDALRQVAPTETPQMQLVAYAPSTPASDGER